MAAQDRRRIVVDVPSLGLAMVLTFTAAACGPGIVPDSSTSPSTTSWATSTGEGRSVVEAADWTRLEEAWRLVGTLGPTVWEGWGEDLPPLLLSVGETDYLVGHPSPPEGFAPVPGAMVADAPVLGRVGHLARGIGVQQLGTELGVAVVPRHELQALLDELLGPGVVALDDVQYVRWVVHEAFHVYQFEKLEMDLPRFGFAGDEMEQVAKLQATTAFGSRLADEAHLLRAAVGATDAELPAKVRVFLEARAARRDALSSDVAGFEQTIEWSEGLARYTDVRILQAAGRDYEPSAGFVALGAVYSDPELAWQTAVAWLDDLSSVPGTLRDRYYELGAAEAYILDRLMPGWQARAFPGEESLEALLTAGVAAAERDMPAELRSLELARVTVESQRYLVAVADRPDSWRRGLAGVDDLGPVDGLLFVFPSAIDAPFHMKGATVPLDVAFFADDGHCLGVQSMSVCTAEPCATYRAPSPYRWALEAPVDQLSDISEGMQIEVIRE